NPQTVGNTAPVMQDFDTDLGETAGARIRYESDATDLLASMHYPAGAASPLTPLQQLQRAEARADQLMLASSVFVPHCSEFIVEWSFGDVDSNGLVVWF